MPHRLRTELRIPPGNAHQDGPIYLIWSKDVLRFSLFHKTRENLHSPELGGTALRVVFTRLSLGLVHITSLQSRSGCQVGLAGSKIQNSHAKFPLFSNSWNPPTAAR